MKTTINKDFFERWEDKKVAMWCKKKEYAEEFCKLMHENGFKWNDGESYLKETVWDTHKEETTYNFNEGLYDTRRFFKNEDYTILDFEDYIVKEKMTKKELVKLLVENFTDEDGVLNLSGLDFSEYDYSVDINKMKVAKDLFQDQQEVHGSLYQENQEVQGDLYQGYQEVYEDLYQSDQKVRGNLIQDCQTVGGNLMQGSQNVVGTLYQDKEDVEYINKTNNLPAHYDIDGIDTMDLILKICEHNNTDVREGFYLANTLIYLIRFNNKNGVNDLEKAKDYLNRLINNQKGE